MWSIQILWNNEWVTVQTGFRSQDDAEWATGQWKQANQCFGDPFRAHCEGSEDRQRGTPPVVPESEAAMKHIANAVPPPRICPECKRVLFDSGGQCRKCGWRPTDSETVQLGVTLDPDEAPTLVRIAGSDLTTNLNLSVADRAEIRERIQAQGTCPGCEKPTGYDAAGCRLVCGDCLPF